MQSMQSMQHAINVDCGDICITNMDDYICDADVATINIDCIHINHK